MTKEEEGAVLSRIQTALDWYETTGATATIEKLLQTHDKLAIMSFTLAEIVSASKGSYLRSYFDRKYYVTAKRLDYRKQGNSDKTSELMAKEDCKPYEETELIQEEYMCLVDLKRQQLNRVIEAVKQRISYAKTEKERALRMENIKTNV